MSRDATSSPPSGSRPRSCRPLFSHLLPAVPLPHHHPRFRWEETGTPLSARPSKIRRFQCGMKFPFLPDSLGGGSGRSGPRSLASTSQPRTEASGSVHSHPPRDAAGTTPASAPAAPRAPRRPPPKTPSGALEGVNLLPDLSASRQVHPGCSRGSQSCWELGGMARPRDRQEWSGPLPRQEQVAGLANRVTGGP